MINPEFHSGGGSRSSNEIESDIRRTRGRMDATLDQLSERLTARSILHTVLDIWESRQPSTPEADARSRRVYGAFSRQVANQVRENPIPTLLIGAGLAWMFLDRGQDREDQEYVELGNRRYRVRASRPSGVSGVTAGTQATDYEYEEVEYDEIDHGPGILDRAKEKLSQGKEAISDAMGAAKDKLSDLGDAAKERVSEIGDATSSAAETARMRARDAYYRGQSGTRAVGHRMQSGYNVGAERFSEAVDEYPLGVGIGFAALGALVGLLLPHTRREDELLGERSDELVDVVKQKGKETFERGKAVAERVAETAIDEAQRQGLTAETAGQAISELATKAGAVAQKVKEEAVSAAEEQHLTPQQVKTETPTVASTEGYSINMPPKNASSTEGYSSI